VDYGAQLAAAVRAAAAETFGEHAALCESALSEIAAFGSELAGHARAAVGELAESLLPTSWLLLEWQTASYVLEPQRLAPAPGAGAGRGGPAAGPAPPRIVGEVACQTTTGWAARWFPDGSSTAYDLDRRSGAEVVGHAFVPDS
jgi:hypothetical protein